MSEQSIAGITLIAVPILFNLGFTPLAQRFDYPDVLRRPTRRCSRAVGCAVHAARSPFTGIWSVYIPWSIWLIAVGIALIV